MILAGKTPAPLMTQAFNNVAPETPPEKKTKQKLEAEKEAKAEKDQERLAGLEEKIRHAGAAAAEQAGEVLDATNAYNVAKEAAEKAAANQATLNEHKAKVGALEGEIADLKTQIKAQQSAVGEAKLAAKDVSQTLDVETNKISMYKTKLHSVDQGKREIMDIKVTYEENNGATVTIGDESFFLTNKEEYQEMVKALSDNRQCTGHTSALKSLQMRLLRNWFPSRKLSRSSQLYEQGAIFGPNHTGILKPYGTAYKTTITANGQTITWDHETVERTNRNGRVIRTTDVNNIIDSNGNRLTPEETLKNLQSKYNLSIDDITTINNLVNGQTGSDKRTLESTIPAPQSAHQKLAGEQAELTKLLVRKTKRMMRLQHFKPKALSSLKLIRMLKRPSIRLIKH